MKGIAALSIAIQAGKPVVAIGAPGVGKSTVMLQLGMALDRHVETVIASLREPSDFAGLPVVGEGGRVHMAAPAWAHRLIETKRKGLLFLDEVSTAAPATQAALLRVVLDRVVGDISLGDNVSVVAAMNPPEQSAGGWELSPPLANRFCHLQWSVDVGAWVDGMLQGFPAINAPRVNEDWATLIPKHRGNIASYVRVNQAKLLAYPKNEADTGKPWPSPRSWDMAAQLMAACESAGGGEEAESQLVIGSIGTGVGMEYLAWRKALDLPDPEDILKRPKEFKLPDRGDRAFTVLTSVAQAVLGKPTAERYMAGFEVFNIAAKQGQKDIATAAIKTMCTIGIKQGYFSNPKVVKELEVLIKPFTEIMKKAGIWGN